MKKQNDEMNRLIDEIKQVQRDINVLQGKIERTFTVTDEIMFTVRKEKDSGFSRTQFSFQVAKGDEAVRRIYKHLLSLHTDCSDILRLIKETGTLSREIKDLENQASIQRF